MRDGCQRRFAALTAARTGEVLLAAWAEFDLDAATWLVPAARMKANKPHTLHLSARALAMLGEVHALKLDAARVVPSPMAGRAGKPLSNMAMLTTLGRLGVRVPCAGPRSARVRTRPAPHGPT